MYQDDAERPVPVERRRHGCLAILLVLSFIGSVCVIVQSLGLAAMIIAGQGRGVAPTMALPKNAPPELANMVSQMMQTMPSVTLIQGMIAILQLVAFGAIWRWKKWGFYLLIATTVISMIPSVWIFTTMKLPFETSMGLSALGLVSLVLYAVFILIQWKMFE